MLVAVAVESLQRRRGLTPERTDGGAVVGVVDVADTMVELELLEGPERAVSFLHQREDVVAGRVDQLGLAGVAQERQRDDDHRHDGDEGAQDQPDHARANESRATRRRCSRASGHIAISAPPRKTNPATQIRFTSGLTRILKYTRLPSTWSRIA